MIKNRFVVTHYSQKLFFWDFTNILDPKIIRDHSWINKNRNNININSNDTTDDMINFRKWNSSNDYYLDAQGFPSRYYYLIDEKKNQINKGRRGYFSNLGPNACNYKASNGMCIISCKPRHTSINIDINNNDDTWANDEKNKVQEEQNGNMSGDDDHDETTVQTSISCTIYTIEVALFTEYYNIEDALKVITMDVLFKDTNDDERINIRQDSNSNGDDNTKFSNKNSRDIDILTINHQELKLNYHTRMSDCNKYDAKNDSVFHGFTKTWQEMQDYFYNTDLNTHENNTWKRLDFNFGCVQNEFNESIIILFEFGDIRTVHGDIIRPGRGDVKDRKTIKSKMILININRQEAIGLNNKAVYDYNIFNDKQYSNFEKLYFSGKNEVNKTNPYYKQYINHYFHSFGHLSNIILFNNKCYFVTKGGINGQNGDCFQIKLNTLVKNYSSYHLNYDEIINWKCERLIWIAYYKEKSNINSNNNINTIKFDQIPKDIIKLILSFLKYNNK